jgi:hypothetical protein
MSQVPGGYELLVLATVEHEPSLVLSGHLLSFFVLHSVVFFLFLMPTVGIVSVSYAVSHIWPFFS